MPKKPRPAAQPNPAFRLSSLRPRLARLLAEQIDAPGLQAEIDRLTDGLKPASFLPVLVSAFAAAPDRQREQFGEPVGAWLSERGLLDALRDLEARQMHDGPAREAARAWLEAGGVALQPIEAFTIDHAFIDAYEVVDTSQASVTLFWYEDARRRRVHAAAFLIDFEPPWEGALKDLAYHTFRDLGRAHGEFFSSWREHDLQQRPVDQAGVARRVWTSLRHSQAEGIRLPADFIAVMGQVVPMLLALPASPDAPALSAAEIEAMAKTGRSPEALRQEERILGYQKRMPDGKILRIIRPPEDYDDYL